MLDPLSVPASSFISTAQDQPVVNDPAPDFSDATWTIKASDLANRGTCNAVTVAVEQGLLKEKLWVGTVGMPTDDLSTEIKSSIDEKLEHDFDTMTVFVDDKNMDGHYTHYCKTMLWPVFHYQIPDAPKSKAFEDHSWQYYVKVNQAFADRVAKTYKRGDIFWIHDYHLLLVPSMLRQVLPDAKIGFFLHVAFPSSEVFRCLATRIELLKGMLGANLIGFQTTEYSHHFLQTCTRLLGLEANAQGIQLDNRFVNVGTFPVGIIPCALDTARGDAEVMEWTSTIREKYAGKKLILARDKLDHVCGVRPKLLAYELFLQKNPQWRDQVVFIQIATSSAKQPDLDASVADVATRVNSHASPVAEVPLVLVQQDIPYNQYLALLATADCLMITSLREGMNLTSHEYVYCQDGKDGGARCGPLILSEFTGSAFILGADGPLLINPWHLRGCADAIKNALEMSEAEKERRWRKLHQSVTHHTGARWLESFLGTLDRVWNEQSMHDTASIPRLSYDTLQQQYSQARRRLFILDYEGTLESWVTPSTIIRSTPSKALGVLNDLIDDPRNAVYVTSTYMPEEMERLFGRVHGIGLIAEEGCYVAEASRTNGGFHVPTWTCLVDEDKIATWKKSMRGILEYYAERIEGGRVEERHCSLLLNCTKAVDSAAARQQVAECADHVNDLCQSQDMHAVVCGGTQLVVKHINISKATAAAMIVTRASQGKAKHIKSSVDNTFPDFLFVAGDSREDEHVFRWAEKLHASKVIPNVFSVSLGHGTNTEAKTTLTGVSGLLSVLQRLAAGR